MLSYQHIYHAGVHADCHKHLVMSLLLRKLREKPTPFRYLDTHSGRGVYDLAASEVQKVQEYRLGIAKLWAIKNWPELAQDYHHALSELNPDGILRHYPGSPMLAHLLRRDQDHLELYELHPQEFAALESNMGALPNISITQYDGWEILATRAAPVENRGLVLIDPSYELKDDYFYMANYLQQAIKKWRNGIYAIWYPLLQDMRHEVMLDGFVHSDLRKVLRSEVIFSDPKAPGMHGSGMLVINPPWQMDKQMDAICAWLAQSIGRNHLTEWLIPE